MYSAATQLALWLRCSTVELEALRFGRCLDHLSWFLRFFHLGRRVANRNRVRTQYLESVCVVQGPHYGVPEDLIPNIRKEPPPTAHCKRPPPAAWQPLWPHLGFQAQHGVALPEVPESPAMQQLRGTPLARPTKVHVTNVATCHTPHFWHTQHPWLISSHPNC